MIRAVRGTGEVGESGTHRPAAVTRALAPLVVEGRARPQEAPQLGSARQLGDAPFLAQLIAARDGLPQARERRRADPREGMAAYGASLERLNPGVVRERAWA